MIIIKLITKMWMQLNGHCVSANRKMVVTNNDGIDDYTHIKRKIEVFALQDYAEIKLSQNINGTQYHWTFKMDILKNNEKLILATKNSQDLNMMVVLNKTHNGYEGVYFLVTGLDHGVMRLVALDPHSVEAKI